MNEQQIQRWEITLDSLGKKINSLIHSGTSKQRMTRRRANIHASQCAEAAKLDECRRAIVGIVAALKAGNLPPMLRGIRDLATLQTVMQQRWDNKAERLVRAGLHEPFAVEQARKFLAELSARRDPEEVRRDELRELERGLVGRKIPGFFPTPRAIVEQMLGAADLGPDIELVLEPSAGKGDIIDVFREYAPDYCPRAKVHACEVNHDLRAILERKGVELVGHDFTILSLDWQYDLILMNPPFEYRQDIEHVMAAFDHLKPGGRIVAIVSAGVFFRDQGPDRRFRDWLDELEAPNLPLPEGAFLSSFVPTGVRTHIVVIDKPRAVRCAREQEARQHPAA